MSVKTMAKVWDMNIGPSEKLVLLAYADHADHDDNNMFPAISRVKDKTGLSERQVQRITRRLEEKGILVSRGTGPNGTNKWSLGRGDILSGVTSVTPPGDMGDTPGVTSVTPEPSVTISKPSLANEEKTPSLPLDWKIAIGQEITEKDLRQEKQKGYIDIANLIAMGAGTNTDKFFAIAYMFMNQRDIPIPQSKVKAQRKPIREMVEMGVHEGHVAEAVQKLLADGMTVTDLYSVSKTAIALANPPKEEYTGHLEGI